jgi:tRNA (mo5U34)-methyltransferase
VTLQSYGPREPSSPVEREIAELAPWFHNITLPTGERTAPDHPLGDFPAFKWAEIAALLPDDLAGWRVLDIGCNAGYYSFACAARGATVLGVDHDERYLRQARWAAGRLGAGDRVAFRRSDVYDLARTDETWDLVLFLGVLYHLRHPLLGLDIVAGTVGRMLVVQSLEAPVEEVLEPPSDLGIDRREEMTRPGWPSMAFIEHRLAGDGSNWWAPNRACTEAMLRSTGLTVTDRPGHEIYVCVPDRTAQGRARRAEAAAGVRVIVGGGGAPVGTQRSARPSA